MYVLLFLFPRLLQQTGSLWLHRFCLMPFFEESYFYFAQLFSAESGHWVKLSHGLFDVVKSSKIH